MDDMKNNMKNQQDELSEAFQQLHDLCGNHSRAADELGLSRTYYRCLRNGRYEIPQRTAEFIILKSRDALLSQKAKRPTK